MRFALSSISVVCTILFTLIWIHEGKVPINTPKGILAVCLLALGGIATITLGLITNKPAVEVGASSQGEPVIKATAARFERDLKDEVFEGDLQKSEKQSSEEAKDYFYAGERALKARKYEDAIRSYQNSIEARPTPSAYMNLGSCFIKLLEFKKAEDYFQKGLTIVEKRGNDELKTSFLANLGNANIGMGNLENASAYYEKMLPILPGNALAEVLYIGGISSIDMVRGNMEKALQGFKKRLEVAKDVKDSTLIQAYTLIAIGYIYYCQDKNTDALNVLLEVEKLIVGSDDISLKAAAKGVKLKVSYAQGKLMDAKDLLYDQFELSKKSGEKIDHFFVIINDTVVKILGHTNPLRAWCNAAVVCPRPSALDSRIMSRAIRPSKQSLLRTRYTLFCILR